MFAGGRMVIVNLQKTPKDRRASLIVRCRVDPLMALLMQELQIQVQCTCVVGKHVPAICL